MKKVLEHANELHESSLTQDLTPMPQVILEISTDLLTTLVHNLLPTWLPGRFGNTIITNVDVQRVIPMRGDERNEDAALTMRDLSQRFDMDLTYVPVLTGGSAFPSGVPCTYLLVSGSFTTMAELDLNITGSSQSGTTSTASSNGPWDAANGNLPPLLFQIRVQPNAFGSGIDLRLNFISVFDDFNAGLTEAEVQGLRAELNGRLIPLPLPGSFDSFGSIVCAGITTDYWDVNTQEPTGLRLAIDVLPSANHLEWWDFFRSQRTEHDREHGGLRIIPTALIIDPTNDEDLGLIVRREYLFERVLRELMAQSGANEDISTGWPSVEFTDGKIVVKVGVHLNSLPVFVGEAVLNVYPSVISVPNGAGGQRATLSLRACPDFDIDPVTAVQVALIGSVVLPVADAFAGGMLLPIEFALGGILGAVGNIAISSVGKSIVAGQLGSLQTSGLCAPAEADGCRVCTVAIDEFIDHLGHFKVKTARTVVDGLVVGISCEPSPRSALLPVAKLSALDIRPWAYHFVVCEEADGNPRKSVRFTNLGQLPLLVTDVSHHVVDELVRPPIQISRSVLLPGPTVLNEPALPQWILLGPGETFAVTVLAAFDGQAYYDPLDPPPIYLRILTSGGAIEVNLNAIGDVAKPQAAGDQQLSNEWAQRICDLLSWRRINWVWPGTEFTDPLPFRPIDRIIDRIEIVGPAAPLGHALLVQGHDGSTLATILDSYGPVQLAVEGERFIPNGPSALRFSLIPSGRVREVRSAAHGAGGVQGDVVPVSRRFRAYALREAAIVNLRERITSAVAWGPRLIVATQSGLVVSPHASLAQKSGGRIPLRNVQAMVPTGDFLAIATSNEVMVVNSKFDPIWRQEMHAMNMVGTQGKFWIADREHLWSFLVERGEIHLRSRRYAPGIRSMTPSSKGVFILTNAVHNLSGERSIQVTDHALEMKGCAFGVFVRTHENFLAIDGEGAPIAQYSSWPRFVDSLVIGDLEFEVRKETGLLVVYERFDRLPAPPSTQNANTSA